MAEYTLKVRRFQPEQPRTKRGAYWEEFDVDLDPTLSVLDGLLQAKDREDGSLAVRCSCRAAICGSCGVKINGQSDARLQDPDRRGRRARPTRLVAGPTSGEPVDDHGRADGQHAGDQGPGHRHGVDPLGEVPPRHAVAAAERPAARARVHRPAEAMVDVTQSVACIQCGACVSSCLSMEADPDFIGPAALAKAYRFVGDPRDGQTTERLYDLANDPHGIYDCTHCF